MIVWFELSKIRRNKKTNKKQNKKQNKKNKHKYPFTRLFIKNNLRFKLNDKCLIHQQINV